MRIMLNGQPHEVAPPAALGALVDTQVDDRRGVAVAVDGEVVPRSEWDTTDLAEGARVEVLAAVQGG